MTQLKDKHPKDIPSVSFSEQGGRKVDFQKDCLGEVTVFRKVNDGAFELLARNERPPYIDEETFGPDTRLTYSVKIKEEGEEEKRYDLPVSIGSKAQ